MTSQNLNLKRAHHKNRHRFHRTLKLQPEFLERRDLLAGDLVITGVIDGPLSGGTPKAIELYAINDVADLSVYGVGSANNGGGTDNVEFPLTGAATAGQFLYVASESTNFESFFGFAPDYTSPAANINGDDAIQLFFDSNADGFASPAGSDDIVTDTFGDIDVDGNGTPWEYLDGWANRVAGTAPDGTTFDASNWTFSGPNALDGETDNASAANPFPNGSYSAANTPEIQVDGGPGAADAVSIVSGDVTPSVNDGTQFGPVAVSSDSIIRTFTIRNLGSMELTLTGTPLVDINGSPDFSVSTQPGSTTIAAGGNLAFDVTYTPTITGSQTASITIRNDDSDEGEFTFDVSGTGVANPTPEIDIQGNGQSIALGDATPESTNGTDFGELSAGSSALQSFTIDNMAGSAVLEIADITITGTHASDFTLTGIPSEVPAGGTQVIDVTFAPSGEGLRSATVTISTNDNDEPSYDFAIQGTSIVVATSITINEVDADTEDENNEFIELYDGGVGNTSLTGLTVVLLNGSDNQSYGSAFDLDGFSTDASGFFVLGDADTPNVDFVPSSFDEMGDTNPQSQIQNGEDAVGLYVGNASDFPNDTPASSTNLLDALVYETNDTATSNLATLLGTNEVIDEDANGNRSFETVSRSPDGSGPFVVVAPTPGVQNAAIVLDPEIDIAGNGQSISAGDDTPTATDGTDFGSHIQAGLPVIRTFTIANSGNGDLNLGELSIAGSSDFTISQPANNAIAPDATTTFDVTLTPSTAGTQTATISLPSNDEDEANYAFDVTANITELTLPEIAVSGNGVTISAGATSPAAADGTLFASVATDGGSNTQSFVISNLGTASLAISGISLAGTNASDFVLSNVPTTVVAGETASFDVTFDPTMDGIRTATITIASDDADEPTYDFDVQGTGITIATNVLINEVDADTVDENNEFIELYDGGVGNTSLDGLVLVLFNGNGGTSVAALDLDGFATDASGFFVIGDADTPNVDLVPAGFDAAGTTSPGSDIQNGEDAVAVYAGDAGDFPNGTIATSANLLDAVVYETGNDPDSTLPSDLGTNLVLDEDANANRNTESVSRSPNGSEHFETVSTTPGTANATIELSSTIVVLGNGVIIANGDDTPATNNFTEFGTIEPFGEPIQRHFTLDNQGTANLEIGTITVAGSSQFLVTQADRTVTPPGQAANFILTFQPGVPGSSATATVSVSSNDEDASPYTFEVTGTTAELDLTPEVTILGNDVVIANGDTTPDPSDATDFGSVETSFGETTETFAITNSGNADLVVGEISISGLHASDFTLGPIPASVAPNSTETFNVAFNATADGPRSATISVQSNDADDARYEFAIQGRGQTAAQHVFINEVDADTEDENHEFVELYDGGVGNTPLDGLVLVLFNGNGGESYEAIDLDGLKTNPSGYFTLGDADTQNVDFTPAGFDEQDTDSPSSDIQNGEDGIGLYVGNASDFPNGTPANATNLLDAIVYETGDDTDSSLLADFDIATVVDEDANDNRNSEASARTIDGLGSFAAAARTPGETNVPPIVLIDGIHIDKYLWDINGLPELHDNLEVGDELIYAFDVTNTGNSVLTDVNITDPMPGLDMLESVAETYVAFDQLSDPNSPPRSKSSSDADLANDPTAARVWDNFSVTETTILDAITWTGSYDGASLADSVEAAFLVEVYSNAAAKPGESLFSYLVSNDSVQTTAQASGAVLYDAMLPFTVFEPGEYWLSISAQVSHDGETPSWYWHQGQNPAGIDGSYSRADGIWEFTSNEDLAFTWHASRLIDFDGTLRPSKTVMYMANYYVTQDDIDKGSIVNTATATAQGANGAVDASDTDMRNIDQSASVSLQLMVDGKDVSADETLSVKTGNAINWGYRVNNNGNVTLSDVNISTDRGLAGVLDQRSDRGGDGVLSPGESWRLSATETAGTGQIEAIISVHARTLSDEVLKEEAVLQIMGSISPAPDATSVDLDGSGIIDFADFLLMSHDYGTPGGFDFADFLFLSSLYGQSVTEVAGNA